MSYPPDYVDTGTQSIPIDQATPSELAQYGVHQSAPPSFWHPTGSWNMPYDVWKAQQGIRVLRGVGEWKRNRVRYASRPGNRTLVTMDERWPVVKSIGQHSVEIAGNAYKELTQIASDFKGKPLASVLHAVASAGYLPSGVHSAYKYMATRPRADYGSRGGQVFRRGFRPFYRKPFRRRYGRRRRLFAPTREEIEYVKKLPWDSSRWHERRVI